MWSSRVRARAVRCLISQRQLTYSRNAISGVMIPLVSPSQLGSRTRFGQITSARCFSSPPHELVGMPSLSPTMQQGNLATWRVKEGDRIQPGTVIAEIETDKATMEFESQEDGFVAKLLVQSGTRNIPVGMPILILVEDEGDIAKVQQGSVDTTPEEPKQSPKGPTPGSDSTSLPSHQVMQMPALSPTMRHGNIAAWRVKEGSFVEPGTVLADIETDKATMEFESQDEGFVAKILVPAGTRDVALGVPILVLTESKEDIGKFASFTGESSQAETKPKTAEAKPQTPQPKPAASVTPAAPKSAPSTTVSPTAGGRVLASPLAKVLAKNKGVDLSQVRGSGPHGRIVEADVLAASTAETSRVAASSAPVAEQKRTDQRVVAVDQRVAPLTEGAGYTDIPHSNIRRIVASKLTESKQQVPHFYLSIDCRMEKLLELRTNLNNAVGESGVKISVNDMVIKAAASALKEIPEVNASFRDNEIRVYNHVDMSVAMQTKQGLIVPVVRNVDAKGLAAISQTMKQLGEKAKANKISPDEMSGGTFTISNLGMFGIKNFSAIINPPQACILAVGATRDEVIVGKKGEFEVGKLMSVTLSCDHRAVDGVLGSQWLNAFKRYIENPSLMLL